MRKIYSAFAIMLITAFSYGQDLRTAFTEFSVVGQVTSTLSVDDATVSVLMPFGADLTALEPQFSVMEGASVYIGDELQQASGTTIDFTSEVVYTIMYVLPDAKGDTISQDWAVNVTNDDPVTITFAVDMSAQAVNEGDYWLLEDDVIYVTGSYDGVEEWGWDEPGTGASILLEDADGDDIWTGTLEYAKNSTFEYKYFLNTGWAGGDGFTNDHPDNNRTAEIGEDDITLNDTWVAIVNKPDAINGKLFENVTAYPNPFDNTLNISNIDNASIVTISDISGKEIRRIDVNSSMLKINTSDLNAGMFIVKVSAENGESATIKMLKK